MPKKIKSVKIETVGKLSSTVKVTTARFNSPVEDTSPLGYVTITEANIRYRLLQDVLVASDVPSIFTSKTFLENTSVLQKSIIVLNKAFSDELVNVEFLDRQFKGIQKPLSDTSLSSDRNINFLGKRVNDQVSLSDSQPIFSLIKSFSDFANPIDLVEIPDGSNYVIEKTIRNTINTSDVFAYIVNFDRILEDTTFASDSDVIAFTKAINDSINTSGDFNIKSIEKVLRDTQLITDNDIISFIKPLSDSQSLSDDDTFAFTKSLADLQALSDDDTYDFTKVATDSQSLSDNDTYSLIKALSEDRPILDDDTYSLIKELSDSKEALDQLTQIILQKSISDFANPIDLLEVPDGSSYTIDKTISNFVSDISDEFNRTIDYNRSFADELSNYTETQVFEVIKALVDESIVLDDDTFAFTKVLVDTQDQSDSDSYSLTKVLADSQLLSDLQLISFDKSLSDTQSQLDGITTITVDKSLSDSQTIDVLTTLDFTKVLSDSQLVSEEIQTKAFIKVLADEQLQSDTITNKTFTKALSDFANPIDLIEIPDGSNYSFDKTLRNTVSNISDEFNREVSFIRSFEDSLNLIDDNNTITVIKAFSDSITSSETITQKTVNKGLLDSSIISDADVIVLTKILVDEFFSIDTPAISFSRTLEDVYNGFQDNILNHITKSFSDFVLVDDSGFTLVRTSPELPLSDSSSIEDAGSLFISDYVDATYFAENYVGIERTFT